MTRIARTKNALTYFTLAMIILATALFYVPTLEYGFIWDDPVWYGHAAGKSGLQTLLPTTDFQFYRPLSTLYVWLFMRPDGSFAIEWLHRMQIGWHLLNIALVYAISHRLNLGRWAAIVTAALFALYPFSYQAVAWAAPNQPMAAAMQMSAWLTYFMAYPLAKASDYSSARRRLLLGGSLVLFLLALAVQESSVVLAFVPLLYNFLLRQNVTDWSPSLAALKSPRGRGWLFALAYVVAAVVYGMLWLQAPRQEGITQLALEPETGLFLLQGALYPVLGRPSGYAENSMAAVVLLIITVIVMGVLLGLAARRQRLRLALFGLIWTGLSLAPAFVGLEYDYVYLASRLFYSPALGVILLWTAALWPAETRQKRDWWRWVSLVTLFTILGQSAWLLIDFAQVFERGTTHLNEAIAVMGGEDGRYLFINFPDRYRVKQGLYPFGYWGLTLAPAVVDIADFVPIVTGGQAESASYSMPWIDTEARAAGPYVVDMRGVIIQPDELYRLATEWNAVYLSRYEHDGRFTLQLAGSLSPHMADGNCLARFDRDVCLRNAAIETTEEGYEVALTWSTERPLSGEQTIFVHLGQPGQPPLAQADGDTWRGMLPLTHWQPGDLIHERRTLPRPVEYGEFAVQIGIYNRLDGRRLRTESDADVYYLRIER